jgi:signal transduction histidine kinase
MLTCEIDQSQKFVITVSDRGEGIPSDDLPHIFDHFCRPDKSRSCTSRESGIGLAIVKELVEAHGGRAWVESLSGQGRHLNSLCRIEQMLLDRIFVI